ncbi:IS110 family transposase [Pseudomonas resinovorans]|uniref:IS110 family transposase n=1 Tax=Metapseudomonas resinovorans TaxID=53412 RepID=A0ABT4YBA9_METRE|nr:IS110 family transposase [Pseudomonas resinovorans]MDA8486006.1 IS110 family transposase [Pseudomonas resinovorans]
MQPTPVTPNCPVHCVDLAKEKFQEHSFSHSGECLKRRTLTRTQFVRLFADPQLLRGLIVMEACASANHWCRRFEALGHRALQLPAQFVAQHRIGSKNDGNDADAIYATHCDTRVRPVPTKTLAQQDLAALHSARYLLLKQRVQLSNQIRGLLAERDCVAAQGARGFEALLSQAASGEEAEVTEPLLAVIAIQLQLLRHVERQLAELDGEVEQLARQLPQARLLTSIFGVGPLIATAFVAEYGAGVARYADARQFAASLGLVPREHSSGKTRWLGGITKRGDAERRRLLVQGASSVVRHCQPRQDPLSVLARRLLERHKCHKVVTLAVANRLARIIYAVLKHGQASRLAPPGRPLLAA